MFILVAKLSSAFTLLFILLMGISALIARSHPDSGKILYATGSDSNLQFNIVDVDSGVTLNLSRHYGIQSIPAIAPTGHQMAWVSAGDITSEIRVADMLSHTVHAFPQPFEVYGLIWSRDSRKLAFEAVSDIYLLDIERGETRHLINHPSGDWYPVWSPDDRHIAFISERDVGNWQIYTVDVDTQESRLLPCPDIPCTSPNWSPDGRYVTFEANSTLYIIDMQTLELQRLTDGKSGDPSWIPLWSPDNRTILFTAHPASGNRDVYSYDWKNLQRHRLTDHPALDQGPIWSPDGTHIAFMSDRAWWFGIYVMDEDGGSIRLLVPDSGALIAWRP